MTEREIAEQTPEPVRRELYALRGRVREGAGEVDRLLKRIEELEAETIHDPLTGLLNRRGGHRALDRMSRRAVRQTTYLSALVLDLDHFKQINDTHGHAVGDVALRAVAGAIRDLIRATDAAIRWGGEEFLVLTENSLDGAVVLAERLRKDIARRAVVAGESVTVSVGVSEGTSGGWRMMIDQADAAMYRAKEAGRDRVAAGGVKEEEVNDW